MLTLCCANWMCCCCDRSAWAYQAAAPLFSTPVIDSVTSTVIVAAVDGAVAALSHMGQLLWLCNLGAQVYAPLCLLPTSHEEATEAAAMATTGEQLPTDGTDADSCTPIPYCILYCL